MKKKNVIFWWLRRKRPVIAINNNQEQKIIKVTKEDECKEEIIDNVDQIIIPTENTDISSIPLVSDNSKKEHDRTLPPEKNERVTLVKPKRGINTKEVIDTKKEINVNTEDEQKEVKEEAEKNLILEEDKKEDSFKARDFIDDDMMSNDIAIKTDTLDEIEKMLKTNYYEIQTVKYEFEILEQKEQDEIVLEEIEKLIEELNKLIKKFEKIKKDFYQKNFEELYDHSTNDNYIGQLIEEYKISLTNNDINENILQGVKQIEEYITLINDIIDIETKKDNITKKLDSKKETLGIRDKEFEDLKDEYTDVEKMNNYIESFTSEYDHLIKDIETKVAASTNITKKAEYKSELMINHTRLLTSALLLAATPAIPFTKGGNLLRMGLMMAAVTGIATSVRTRTSESKVTTNINFIDYAKEIQTSINDVSEMSLMIDKAKLDIKNIKEEFKKEFAEYVDLIPEYSELISNLDAIEKDLLVKADIAKEYDKKLENVLEENNVKVKRLEEEIPN